MAELPPGWEVHERRSAFTREKFAAIVAPRFEWLVRGVLPIQGFGFLAGPSGAGKSFVALDLALRISTGRDALEARTRTCSVAYIGAEDPYGLRVRIAAWRHHFQETDADFEFIGQAPNLRDESEFEDLATTLSIYADEEAGSHRRLGLVVIDTLSQSIPGADENSSTDMSPVTRNLAKLSERLGCFILVIAHTGKDEERGIRGWSGLLANSDATVMVKRTDEGRSVTMAKVKNGVDGRSVAFALHPVKLGTDAEGEDEWSMVVDWRGAQEPASKAKNPAQNDRHMYVLAELRKLLDAAHGVPVPVGPDVPKGTFGMLRSDFKDALWDLGLAGEDDKPNAFRVRLNRDIETLVRRGLVRATPKHLWPAKR